MKFPFYTVLGPLLKRHYRPIKKFCQHPLLEYSNSYVVILGSLGLVLSVFDIFRVIKCGGILPEYLARKRLKERELIGPEVERDFKLVSLVLSAEYYFWLLVGLATNNPIFFLPFLSLYALIITMELTIFSIKLLSQDPDMSKPGICKSLFMLYNWASVFCAFTRLTTSCDI